MTEEIKVEVKQINYSQSILDCELGTKSYDY